jgi:ABC-2 type transport system permease protein
MMKVFSFIPFTSPIAMFVRIAMSVVPAYEVIISLAVLFASMIVTGYAAAIIYRMGVLLYGKPPKPGELFRMLRRAVKES